MIGDELPDRDHVTRLCNWSQLTEEGWPDGSAFILKLNEPYLSVNWLEHLDHLPSQEERIVEVLRVLCSKRTVKPSAKLALLNVGTARSNVLAGTNDRLDIRFRHEPEDGPYEDSSHTGIYNLPLLQGDVAASIQLALSVIDVLPVR